MDNIERHPAIQEDSMGDRLQFGIDGFNQILAVEGFTQERFQNWQQILRFVESESAGRHRVCTYSNPFAMWRGRPRPRTASQVSNASRNGLDHHLRGRG